MHDLQKASMWKRISAYIFDSILIVIVAVGVAFLMSSIFGYDSHTAKREQLRKNYESEYGVSFDIEAEEYEKLTDAERKKIDDAYAVFATDPEVNRLDLLIINLTLLILVFSILSAVVIFELIVPFLLGHGRTLGKKIFGIAVIRVDGVRASAFQMFVRSILGKYTLETMIPIFLIVLLFFNVWSAACLVGLGLLLILQISFLLFSEPFFPV